MADTLNYASAPPTTVERLINEREGAFSKMNDEALAVAASESFAIMKDCTSCLGSACWAGKFAQLLCVRQAMRKLFAIWSWLGQWRWLFQRLHSSESRQRC